MDMTPQAWADWYDGKHINEVLFCQQFLEKHPMKCVRGRLFTVDGLIEDEGQIGNLILEEISGVLTSGLSKVVTNLLASIKLQAYSPPLPIETDRIIWVSLLDTVVFPHSRVRLRLFLGKRKSRGCFHILCFIYSLDLFRFGEEQV